MTAAFLLFRVMDIVKPWPVSLLDRIDSPLGILADDLAAGLLAAGALLVAGMLLPW
jgi:phosphatidylglycerophosphatase A